MAPGGSTQRPPPTPIAERVSRIASSRPAIAASSRSGIVCSNDMTSARSASVPLRVAEEPGMDRVSLWRTPRTRALLLLGTLGVVGGVFALVARFYTDLLWFQELGVVGVYLDTLRWKILAAGVVGLGTTCFVLLNF